MKKYSIKNYWFFIGVALIFGVWFLSSQVVSNEIVVPKISTVFKSLVELLKDPFTYKVIFKTVSRLIASIALTFIVAIVLSLVSSIFKKVGKIIEPFIALLRVVPIASIIIILLMIFGNNKSPYIITGLVVFPIMYEAFLTNFNLIDKSIMDEVKMISSFNYKVARYIYIPLTLPRIISTLLTIFGLGLKVMVMAEFITQPKDTIGYVMLQEKNFLEMANVFSWTIILVIFILLVEALLRLLKRKIEAKI